VRGRPRSVEADDAILDAAICVFCEHGYDGLTVEGVAARAGVGKTTIYRRYPSKADLIMTAVARAQSGFVPYPDTGSLREDLLEFARGFVGMITHPQVGRTIPMTLAAKERSPEIAASLERLVTDRRELTYEAIRRGITRGELPVGTDPSLIADVITGGLFMRVYVTGEPVDEDFVVALVDRALAV
jgi:AcrR family transcriptional regulator